MMSSAADETDEVCASCGVAAIDDIKLKDCDAGCDLVKYCSDDCQKDHREHHEEECKKQLAELRDRDLFAMPDGCHHGECPICCLPLEIDPIKSRMMVCCSKLVCNGCNVANQKREVAAGLQRRCVFCRQPAPKTDVETEKRRVKRIKKNCPVAMREEGKKRRDEGDYDTAFEYFTKAAELGDAGAHYELSIMYRKGQFVEKGNEREIHHLEEAVIRGHPAARHDLGCEEANNGDFDRAKKHFIIAANLGYHGSLKCLRQLYADGHASKEEYADALRAYQAAVNATKSPERAAAEVFEKIY
jgi:hypothetical protein